jgi:hypothetical protein
LFFIVASQHLLLPSPPLHRTISDVAHGVDESHAPPHHAHRDIVSYLHNTTMPSLHHVVYPS